MIVSFGFAHRQAPPRAQKVFDVLELTHDTDSPEFQDKRQEILDYVQKHPNETIAIGCEKGRHRSPSLANTVANATRQSWFHRD